MGSEGEKANPKWSDAMTSWYDEIDDFRENPTQGSTDYLGTGHFTQLIWGKTQYVGCGFIAHEGYGGNNKFDTKYYVCNYGPAGNWLRQKVFSAGSPCSKCPAGSTCNNGLCRDQSAPTVNGGKPNLVTPRPSMVTMRPNYRPTTRRTNTNIGGKPKCDLKILKKYINSCEA